MSSGGSENSKAGAIPVSSTDGTHDWECARKALQRSFAANTDTTGDSECSFEEWDCTPRDLPRDILLLDEGESSPALDGDALHAHRWDLIHTWSSHTHTYTPCARPSARVTKPAGAVPERSLRSPHPAPPALPPAPHPRTGCPCPPYARPMREQGTQRRFTASLPY